MEALAEFLASLSLIIACWTAIIGINAWRREFMGKRKIELAEEVLALFYEIEDALRDIRNPMSYVGEGSTREKQEDETEKDTANRNRAFVVYERYRRHQDKVAHLRSLKYRCMARFENGADAAEPFDDMVKIFNELFFAAQILPDYWQRQGTFTDRDEEFKAHLKEKWEFESVIWAGRKEDTFTPKIIAMIEKAEKMCQSQMKDAPSLVTILTSKCSASWPLRRKKKKGSPDA